MNLHDLTDHERLALGGLLRLVVRLDGRFSAEESSYLANVGDHYGAADLLWNAISLSSQRHQSEAEIYEAALRVERDGARQLMIAIADSLAAADQVTSAEHDLLVRIRHLWTRDAGAGPYRGG